MSLLNFSIPVVLRLLKEAVLFVARDLGINTASAFIY